MFILYLILGLLLIGATVTFFESLATPDGMVEFGGEMRHWEDLWQENLQLQLSVVVLILIIKTFAWVGTLPEGTTFRKKFMLHFWFGAAIVNILNVLFVVSDGLWETQEEYGLSMLGIYWAAIYVLGGLLLGLLVYTERKNIWTNADA